MQVHQRFALVQRLDDDQLVEPDLGDLVAHQRARDDTDHLAAGRLRGARRDPHQPDRAAAVDELHAAVGEQQPERLGGRGMRRIMAGARAAEQAERSDGRHDPCAMRETCDRGKPLRVVMR